jgi:hypothetical protein
MGCRRNKVVRKRELARSMGIAAFNQARARKSGPKLAWIELLLGRKLVHASPAVFAKDKSGSLRRESK